MKIITPRIRKLAFFLAIIMILGTMPLTVLAEENTGASFTAEWASGSVWLYTGVNQNATITHTSQFPSLLYVTKVAEGWYHIDNTDWLDEFENLRYVPEKYLTNITALSKTLSAQIGSFNVSVEGDSIPLNAQLSLSEVSSENYDENAANYVSFSKVTQLLGVYDIKIMHNESEWQPSDDERVKVSMNAAAWGLYTGQKVYIVHVHENPDGTKNYQNIGPLKVKSGKIDFEVNGFSDFYVIKGTDGPQFSFTNGATDEYYVEPGAIIRFGSTPTWTVITGAEGIRANGNSITVDSTAEINTQAEFTATWSGNGCSSGGTQTIKVIVSTRNTVANGAISKYPIGIFIRQPAEGTADYPSEPGDTVGEYYRIQYDSSSSSGFIASNATTNFTNDILATDASNFLNPNIGLSPAWMYSPDGKAIGGIVDATGRYSLDAFKIDGVETIDWNMVALTIANYNNGKTDANRIQVRFMLERANGSTEVRTVFLVNDSTKTLASILAANNGDVPDDSEVHYEEFELIPYVIKLMKDGWHVDVAVIHESSYLLGYDINLGEGYTTNDTLQLPSAQIVVDYANNGIGVNLTPGSIEGLKTITYNGVSYSNSINVRNSEGETGIFQFQGWFTSNTAQSTDTLIQPGQSFNTTADTTLYAIWEYTDGEFVVETGSLSIYKKVSLAPGSPFGSKVPTATDGGYVEFLFDIKFNLDVEYLDDITFDANKLNKSNNVAETISGSLAGVLNGTETYDFLSYTSTGGIYTFTIKLGDGENFHFLDVPIDSPSENGTDPDTYTVTETIPSTATRYSAASATTLNGTMSVAADAEFRFENYYTPPVAGLEISTSDGDPNACYIFVLEATDIPGFLPVNISVPAGETVTVVGLATGTYKITEVQSWNTHWTASQNSVTVTLSEGVGEASFRYSIKPNEKWLCGHGFTVKSA